MRTSDNSRNEWSSLSVSRDTKALIVETAERLKWRQNEVVAQGVRLLAATHELRSSITLEERGSSELATSAGL